jgi:hypothetical protein
VKKNYKKALEGAGGEIEKWWYNLIII